jgi:hypothetical protein
VTRLLDPPLAIEVEVDEAGRPRLLSGAPVTGPTRAVQRWIVEVDWWDQPVSREYWQVVVRRQLVYDIYRDLADGAWYLERVYD